MDGILLADATSFAWVAPVMTVAAAVVAGYFARSSQRDKLAFDADLAQLKADNAKTRRRLAKAIKKLAAMEASLKTCHAERDALQVKVTDLEETCERQQKEIDRLNKDVVRSGLRADSTEQPTG